MNKIRSLKLSDDVMGLVNEQLNLIEEYVDVELNDDILDLEKKQKMRDISRRRKEVLSQIRSKLP